MQDEWRMGGCHHQAGVTAPAPPLCHLHPSSHPLPHPPSPCLLRCAALLQEGRWAEALSAIPLVTVKPSATFRETIMNLIDHNKHR